MIAKRWFAENRFAFLITGVSFFLTLACALFNFSHLTGWDGEWYRHIVENGYSATRAAHPENAGLGNVGFFPGFPFFTYLCKKVFGLGSDAFPTTGALLITANCFAGLTWIYFKKWIDLFRPELTRAALLLLALYPFTFLFYCSYTESLFISMLLGFLYFSERFIREEDEAHLSKWLGLALLHGFFMNSTRMLGWVISLYPILRAIQVREKMKRSLLISIGSLSSIALFFLYCKIEFQHWDQYFITERAIWGTYIDWQRLLPPRTLFDFTKPTSPNVISRYITILSGGYFALTLSQKLKRKEWFSPAFATFLCAGMMWGEYFLGRTSWNYAGMGRYLIPVFAMYLPFTKINPKLDWKWVTLGVVMLGFQVAFALKFGRHGWVS